MKIADCVIICTVMIALGFLTLLHGENTVEFKSGYLVARISDIVFIATYAILVYIKAHIKWVK